MKNIEELNQSKLPIIPINHALDIYETLPVFQEKTDKANAILKKTRLPKRYFETNESEEEVSSTP